jgi:hypothetical protein
MEVSKFTREELILAGVALLLVIDLLLLPWFDISVGIGSFQVSATSSATGAPDGWLGVLAGLVLIALVADLALERLANVEVPAIGGSRGQTRLVLAAVAAGFVGLKFLFHIHFSMFGFGFWAGIVLAVALVVVAARARDAVGRPAMVVK